MLTWADGEQGAKALQITARTDGRGEEGSEELTLTLTDPSGGAIVGAQASTALSIIDVAPDGAAAEGSAGCRCLRSVRRGCVGSPELIARTVFGKSSRGLLTSSIRGVGSRGDPC